MNSRFKIGLMGATGIFVVLLGLAVWSLSRVVEKRFQAALSQPVFPSAELAMLDRDVQARFAVVPEQDFGLNRMGKMGARPHALYFPTTRDEKQTVSLLKQKELDVMFYVMSRKVWLSNSPLEQPTSVRGAVRISGKFRFIGNSSNGFKVETPSGEVTDLPTTKELRLLGNQVFRMVEAQPQKAAIVSQSNKSRFSVVAVPIKVRDQACVNCHNSSTKDGSEKIKLGDAVGVAFYAYK